ncbi:MAG: DsrE family protein [Deltaproteobacteria bacterium]|nr:DsrE family protein [Deltaproteobacteria bacterium]
MKILIILNDAPYGSERTYNGLRLAGSLVKQADVELKVFLIGDAAAAAARDQKVPTGHYNVEVMLKTVGRGGGEVGVCGSCMDARGLKGEMLADGCHRSTMEELATWTLGADRVLVF